MVTRQQCECHKNLIQERHVKPCSSFVFVILSQAISTVNSSAQTFLIFFVSLFNEGTNDNQIVFLFALIFRFTLMMWFEVFTTDVN